MKIGTKLIISYLVLIVILLLITASAYHYLSQQFLIHEARHQLHKEGLVVSRLLKTVNVNEKAVTKTLHQRQKLHNLSKLVSDHLIIFSKDKKVLYTTLNQQMQDTLKQHRDLFITDKVPILSRSGTVKGYVMVITNHDNINALNNILKKSVWISLLLSTLIAISIAFILERSLTGPLRRLTQYVNHFSLKSKQKPIFIKTRDEIRELADAFNELLGRLKRYDQDQKAFLQNISHELKTPLMSIQGNTEGILDGVIEQDDMYESLRIIGQETQRMKKLVEEMSYLTKLEKIEEMYRFVKEDISIIIDEAILGVKAIAAQDGITINMPHIEKNTYFVFCDHDKLTRAFINVLNNAIGHAFNAIEVVVYDHDGVSIGVEIKDDGQGIQEDNLENIFNRFFSRQKNGTGLGLAITRAIIDAHHGTITAENRLPHGAVFRITLPKK